jgi:prolipoprotein diacylglyceryltransferase
MLLVSLFCFLLFLYIVYYLSRDDFVLTRKDIPVTKVFSLGVLSGLIALLSARLIFVFSHPTPVLLNPLGFLAFYRYAGLSLIGAIAGVEILIYAYCRYQKMPAGKIFDLFTLSLLGVLPVGLIGNFIVNLGRVGLFVNLLFVFSLLLLILFGKFIYPFSTKGEIKDGSLGFIFVAIFSLVYFLTELFLNLKDFAFLNPENILLLILLFSSLILLLNQEMMDKFLAKK